MTKPIVNIEEIELQATPPAFQPTGKTALLYEAKMGQVGSHIGAKLLGYNITELPPGKRAFPFHNHQINEEMFLILEGNGEVRIGTETFDISKGDIIACPPGGKDKAHQIINSSKSVLRFLAISTKISPEVAEYPDSGKFGVLAEFPHESDAAQKSFRFISKKEKSLGYWEGE